MSQRASTSLSFILFSSIVIVAASVVATQFLGLGVTADRPSPPSLDITQSETGKTTHRVTITALDTGDAKHVHATTVNGNNIALDTDDPGGYLNPDGPVADDDTLHVDELEEGDRIRVTAEYENGDMIVRSYVVR